MAVEQATSEKEVFTVHFLGENVSGSLVPRLTPQLWCRLHFHNSSYVGVCLQCCVEFDSLTEPVTRKMGVWLCELAYATVATTVPPQCYCVYVEICT